MDTKINSNKFLPVRQDILGTICCSFFILHSKVVQILKEECCPNQSEVNCVSVTPPSYSGNSEAAVVVLKSSSLLSHQSKTVSVEESFPLKVDLKQSLLLQLNSTWRFVGTFSVEFFCLALASEDKVILLNLICEIWLAHLKKKLETSPTADLQSVTHWKSWRCEWWVRQLEPEWRKDVVYIMSRTI